MKKIIVALAALLVGGVAFAQTVSSANIVGYSKKTVTNDTLRIVSPQFLAADTNGIALKDAFSGLAEATTLYAYDGGYTKYEYYAPTWYNADAGYINADDVMIQQGASAWLTIPANTAEVNIIMSGNVPTASSITNTAVEGLTLMANPYPVELALKDIPTNNLVEATTIYAYDDGYTKYEFYTPNWYNADAGYIFADDVTIAVGDGFWVLNPTTSNIEIIFEKQY